MWSIGISLPQMNQSLSYIKLHCAHSSWSLQLGFIFCQECEAVSRQRTLKTQHGILMPRFGINRTGPGWGVAHGPSDLAHVFLTRVVSWWTGWHYNIRVKHFLDWCTTCWLWSQIPRKSAPKRRFAAGGGRCTTACWWLRRLGTELRCVVLLLAVGSISCLRPCAGWVSVALNHVRLRAVHQRELFRITTHCWVTRLLPPHWWMFISSCENNEKFETFISYWLIF